MFSLILLFASALFCGMLKPMRLQLLSFNFILSAAARLR